jgi:hypothetical protein
MTGTRVREGRKMVAHWWPAAQGRALNFTQSTCGAVEKFWRLGAPRRPPPDGRDASMEDNGRGA